MIPDEKSHGLGIQRESCKYKMAYYLFFFRQFWVKEPRHSENIFARKRYTLINLRRFGVEQPRHSETVFARKRYTLTRFTTILG